MFQICALLMMLLLYPFGIHIVQAENDWFISFIKKDNNKYCGKSLVAALHLICDGVYYPMFKKSKYYGSEGDIDNKEAVLFPFQDRSSAFSLGDLTFHRKARGVYDECCQKSCSLHEILSYCGTQ